MFDLDLGEADLEPAVDRLPELPPGLASKLRAGLSRLLVRPRPEVPVAEAVFNMELQKAPRRAHRETFLCCCLRRKAP